MLILTEINQVFKRQVFNATGSSLKAAQHLCQPCPRKTLWYCTSSSQCRAQRERKDCICSAIRSIEGRKRNIPHRLSGDDWVSRNKDETYFIGIRIRCLYWHSIQCAEQDRNSEINASCIHGGGYQGAHQTFLEIMSLTRSADIFLLVYRFMDDVRLGGIKNEKNQAKHQKGGG